MRLTLLVAATSVLWLAGSGLALAQTTTNGLFGQNTVGGSAASRTPAASSNARTSTGASTGGTSANANVAQTAQQNAAAGAASTTQVRGAFVGADSQDTTNARSLQAIQGTPGAQTNNNMSALNNLFSQSLQQLNQQTQKAGRPKIRVPLRSGIQPQPVSAPRVQKFVSHLTILPGIHFVGPAPQVEMQGRTAILRGTVATEDDRRLAEALAKFEPEILAVRNELKVDSTATAPETLPRP